MAARYKRRLEFFEAVQFVRINRVKNVPEFNNNVKWVEYALNNKVLQMEGEDLIWGHKELDRRIKPGNWLIRSHKTGVIKFKSDLEFYEQFEVHIEAAL